MMRKYVLYFVAVLSCILIYTSCYYDKASLVYPSSKSCDTTNVQLSTDLNNIMSVSCFSCHSSANASSFGGNYNLEDYNTIKTAASNGKLLSSIKQDGILALPMPQSGAKLSDCNINKFSAWINAGAPEN
ncbi:hypothetical protein FRZ67_14995 [Panacibacter ginsenosidivorans]|uniref:Cytochrome c domain-containing protein n=1 Tax=Panacibacter ginsenosidivorans TaxID=1813871 RepID=A0A5B8VE49_9BACT|nr:hypothetical protein [Panacibacter ginsenosidivorans]QEC68548.1 hypothetical protein FRZ67_14995 [Panacibacter ginsenosidivorans]